MCNISAVLCTTVGNSVAVRFRATRGSDVCIRLTTLPPSYAVVMKSGNLNFLEPSGPLWACNGTALLLEEVMCLHTVQDMLIYRFC
jgi:hypothetical protein